jgi:hypothetical protein
MMEWILKCVSIELVDCSFVWLAQKLSTSSCWRNLFAHWLEMSTAKMGGLYILLYTLWNSYITFFSIGTHHAGGRRQFRLSLVTFLAVIPYALWTWCCCWWNFPNNCVVPSSSALYYVCVKTYLIYLKTIQTIPINTQLATHLWNTTCFVHLLSSSLVM